MKELFKNFVQAFDKWKEDDCAELGASLAYYSVFSLAPLLLLTIALSDIVFEQGSAQQAIVGQVDSLFGKQSVEVVQSMITVSKTGAPGLLTALVGILILIIGASGVLLELKRGLNKILKLKEKHAGFKKFIRNRLVSMAMVLGIGFLTLVSLVFSAVLLIFGNWISKNVPFPLPVLQLVNGTVSFIFITGLFALLFKFMPETIIPWNCAWLGALTTSVLFSVGKFFIGFYLGRYAAQSAYGAAGSLIVVLVWVYYSAQIFYFGAEVVSIHCSRLSQKL